jgi:MoxR-like ATPase
VDAPALQPDRAAELLGRLDENVHRVIVGKDSVVRLVITALVAQGHVLLQDLPGTGKTMLGRAVATSVGGAFQRLQCTPDLLPADITGASLYNQRDATFEFVPGPVFANVLLADEINRATPRTQSALLEAMAEAQVTVEGTTRHLPRPFFVIATQNPGEFHGTYPLPESQLDRFLCATEIGPLSSAEAMEVLARREHGDPIADLEVALTLEEVLELQRSAMAVVAAPPIRQYIVSLLEAVRARPEVTLPASMRAGVYLQRAAQAWALIEGRDFVLPDDVKALAVPVLAHRIGLHGRKPPGQLIAEVLTEVPLPALRPA